MGVYGRRVRLTVDAAWHRHERLRVTPHTVLADVQSLELFAGGHAQPDCLLDDPEEAVAEGEDSRERDHDRDRLRAKLVEAPRVEEAALAHAVELRQRRDGEQAAAERA